MDLSINLGYILKRNNGGGRPGYVNNEPRFPLEYGLQMAKEIGFKKIDFDGSGCTDVEKTREIINGYGLTVNQSHAPCNFFMQKDYDWFARHLLNSIKFCQKLGSEIFVVHGNQMDRSKPYVPAEVLEFNYRLYSPIVEFAAINGMKVAFENTITNEKQPSFCSNAEELIALTEKFADSGAVGICWDLGHGNVMFDPHSVPEMAKTKDWLIATHVHDNYFGRDMHGIPFSGNLDWNAVMQTLKDIDYKGDFTFEFVYKNYPDELVKDILQFAYKAGNYLLSL